MRKLRRLPLGEEAEALLQRRTAQIEEASEGGTVPGGVEAQRTEASRLWEQERTRAFGEVRDTLRAMAPEVERCMYCENSEGTDIEHFRPRAAYPTRTFDWQNLLWACSACNSNHKRSRFPCDEAGEPLLIHPVDEDPAEHLAFLPASGRFDPRTRKGEESIAVFGLDRRPLVEGRRDAWWAVQVLLDSYASACASDDSVRALHAQRVLCRSPFASVLSHLLVLLSGPAVDDLVRLKLIAPGTRLAVETHPAVRDWL